MTNSVKTSVNTNGNTMIRLDDVELNWENVQQPRVDMNGNRVFDIQMVVSADQAKEAVKVIHNLNPESGKFTARRAVFAGKPKVVDAEGNMMQERIGNGSRGNIILEKMMSSRGVEFMTLVAVQVTQVVDYDTYKETKDDFMF